MLKAFFIALLVIAGLLIGWHILFPLLGGVMSIAGSIFGVILVSIVMFCVAIMLVFLFTGLGIFFLSLFAFVWIAIAVSLFPVLFPILVPLLIILIFISYVRRRQNKKRKSSIQNEEGKDHADL